jgi:hypothetical protein
LNVALTVQNTGTGNWLGTFGYPGWIVDILHESWAPDPPGTTTHYYTYRYSSVSAAATDAWVVTVNNTPTAVGNYSFDVGCYYPASGYGNPYNLMAPGLETRYFNVNAAAKSWSRSAETLNWGDAGNWSPSGVADATNDVTFGFTGLNDGDTIQLGGDRSANSLAFNTMRTFTIGGSSGGLTLATGTLTRSLGSAGTQTIARDVILGSSGTWEISGAGKLTISGSVTVGAASTLTKTGNGTLEIKGTQSWGAGSVFQIGGSGGSTPGYVGGFATNSVPGPATLAMLASGGLCLLVCRWWLGIEVAIRRAMFHSNQASHAPDEGKAAQTNLRSSNCWGGGQWLTRRKAGLRTFSLAANSHKTPLPAGGTGS